MNYTLICNGQEIAQFVHEPDAEMCLVMFQTRYSDCEFELQPIIK